MLFFETCKFLSNFDAVRSKVIESFAFLAVKEPIAMRVRLLQLSDVAERFSTCTVG